MGVRDKLVGLTDDDLHELVTESEKISNELVLSEDSALRKIAERQGALYLLDVTREVYREAALRWRDRR